MRTNIWCLSLQVWPPSLSIIFSDSIHFHANSVISLFFPVGQDPVVHMYHIFITYSVSDGYFRGSHFLAILNRQQWPGMCRQASLSQDAVFQVYDQECFIYVICLFQIQLFEKHPHLLPQWLYQFIFLHSLARISGHLFS